METVGTLFLHLGGVSLMAAMVLLANVYTVHTVGEATARYKMIKTTNNIDLTKVSKRYENTRSVLHCGKRCANINAPSFYFVDHTSTCHCSNHHDPNIIEDTGPGFIKYGLLVKEETGPREGNSSECQILLFYHGVRDGGLYNASNGELVFCNLTALGWVMFQRRLDGSVDFNRSWTEYVNGFGDPNGEFWLGLETIHQMTKNGCELHVYLEAKLNETVRDNGFAQYSSFFVSNVTDNYRLHVTGFSGNIGDALAYHDGAMFSTYDVDNDGNGCGCALFYGGAWWYICCHMSALNGAFLGETDIHGIDNVAWYDWKSPQHNPIIHTEMAYKC